MTITIDPISDDQLNQAYVSVTGTVSDTNQDVWVNGIQATVNSNGTWFIDDYSVPVKANGTASLRRQLL